MRRAVAIVPAGLWPEDAAVASITLACHDRFRRRIRLTDDGGGTFLLDLPSAALMAEGDGLRLEGSGYVRVRAADEAVADLHGLSAAHVARLAWHLGNRHASVQVLGDGGLRILDDHVLVAMAKGLGARVTRQRAPFAPERGAYDHPAHDHSPIAVTRRSDAPNPDDAGALTAPGLYRLLAWLSPAFPVGGYSYSHGLETAIADGRVRDARGLAAWIATVLARGNMIGDGVLLREAWHAARTGDAQRLDAAIAWAEAWRGTAELALESTGQGVAFIDAVRRSWPDPRIDDAVSRWEAARRAPAYGAAVGAVAGWANMPLRPTLHAFVQAAAAQWISVGVRLIPLGQNNGQGILATLEPAVGTAADAAMARPWDDLGQATPMLDLASTQHETLYTRIFRS